MEKNLKKEYVYICVYLTHYKSTILQLEGKKALGSISLENK